MIVTPMPVADVIDLGTSTGTGPAGATGFGKLLHSLLVGSPALATTAESGASASEPGLGAVLAEEPTLEDETPEAAPPVTIPSPIGTPTPPLTPLVQLGTLLGTALAEPETQPQNQPENQTENRPTLAEVGVSGPASPWSATAAASDGAAPNGNGPDALTDSSTDDAPPSPRQDPATTVAPATAAVAAAPTASAASTAPATPTVSAGDASPGSDVGAVIDGRPSSPQVPLQPSAPGTPVAPTPQGEQQPLPRPIETAAPTAQPTPMPTDPSAGHGPQMPTAPAAPVAGAASENAVVRPSVQPPTDTAAVATGDPAASTDSTAAPLGVQPDTGDAAPGHEQPPGRGDGPAPFATPMNGSGTTETGPAPATTGPAVPAAVAPAPSPTGGPLPAPDTAIAPSVLPAAIAQQTQAAQRAADAQHRTVIRLDPPELGSVTVEVRALGDDIAIVARTDSAEATRALVRQRHDMQLAIESLGMSLSGFDVQTGSDSQLPDRDRTTQPGTRDRNRPDPERAFDQTEPSGSEGDIFL